MDCQESGKRPLEADGSENLQLSEPKKRKEETDQRGYLAELPSDCKLHILRYLEHDELDGMAGVCAGMHDLCKYVRPGLDKLMEGSIAISQPYSAGLFKIELTAGSSRFVALVDDTTITSKHLEGFDWETSDGWTVKCHDGTIPTIFERVRFILDRYAVTSFQFESLPLTEPILEEMRAVLSGIPKLRLEFNKMQMQNEATAAKFFEMLGALAPSELRLERSLPEGVTVPESFLHTLSLVEKPDLTVKADGAYEQVLDHSEETIRTLAKFGDINLPIHVLSTDLMEIMKARLAMEQKGLFSLRVRGDVTKEDLLAALPPIYTTAITEIHNVFKVDFSDGKGSRAVLHINQRPVIHEAHCRFE